MSMTAWSRIGYVLGGEQSGHIIFKEHATTGDGLLTALKLLEVMSVTGKSVIEPFRGSQDLSAVTGKR